MHSPHRLSHVRASACWYLFAAFALSPALLLVRGEDAPAAPAVSPSNPPRPEWQDETRVHEGTVAPFASMAVFPDEASARAMRREDSPFFRSLDGDWKFRWVHALLSLASARGREARPGSRESPELEPPGRRADRAAAVRTRA